MSGAAQREETIEEVSYGATGYGPTGTDGALKQLAAERLAAHRSRRAEAQAQEDALKAMVNARRIESRRGASRVRDTVAARYESSVSYREFLAAESERALQKAQAEAEIAARNAVVLAEAQEKLLAELEHWNRPEPAMEDHRTPMQGLSVVECEPVSGLKVRMFEELGRGVPAMGSAMRRGPATQDSAQIAEVTEELEQLEQEIEFRLSPDFVDHNLETLPIPANIIEFPRQLVAPRKARPRLAEGPLREESEPEPQLRIFEVEPEQISMEPAAVDAPAPDWQSLQLEAATAVEAAPPLDAQFEFAVAPQPAPLELRLMAAAVDGCCMTAAFVAFACVAAGVAGPYLHGIGLPALGASIAGTLLAIFTIYQMLFFTLNEATPGMQYARIGLCTFADANPTRKAMRRRVFATLLAACPLGLGIFWTVLDSERLGWHDRMSRMYPRAY